MSTIYETSDDSSLVQFSTRRLPPARRRQAWDEALARLCGPVVTDHGPQFDGRIDLRRVGGLPASRLTHNARFSTRGRREILEGEPGLLQVVLQLSGRSQLRQANQDAQLMPGDMAMLDSAKPYSIAYEQRNTQVWVHLPRKLLEQGGSQTPPRLAVRLTGSPAILIGSMIRTAFGNAAGWSDGQAAAIREALTRLAVETWLAPEAARSAEYDRLVPPIVNEIQGYIIGNLRSAALTPETIARAHGLSVRHLHRLFRLTGMTLARWIRRSRLDRCAADLLDHGLAAESVTGIAYGWGFNDSAHFSRAFKAEFGLAPRSYRLERRLHS